MLTYVFRGTSRSQREGIEMQPTRRYRAVISLVSTADGGRQGYIASRYVGAFWIGHMHGSDRAYNDARITLLDQDVLQPGDTASALLDPIAPEFWTHIDVDSHVEFYEGSRRVGFGSITEVMDETEPNR